MKKNNEVDSPLKLPKGETNLTQSNWSFDGKTEYSSFGQAFLGKVLPIELMNPDNMPDWRSSVKQKRGK